MAGGIWTRPFVIWNSRTSLQSMQLKITVNVFLVDEDEVPQDDLVHVGMQSWTEAIDSCLTLSRLHLLLCMFDSCVKWEKSAENAVSNV